MNRAVLIGLDGATFSLLDPLMEDGHMPFLRDLINRGFRAKLLSTPNPLTPPAWISMITGRSPGNHGIHDFIRSEERNGTIYFTLYNSSDILCENIWSIASQQGRRVIHLNFPMMAPPQPINGLVIPSMVQWRHLKRNIYPRRLFETLESIPDFKAEQWGLTYWEANEAMRERALFPKEEKDWVTRHMRRDHQWFIILRHLMQHDPADLTAIVFDGMDKLQHLCWRLIDPNLLPAKMLDWEQRMRNYVLEYFRSIDGYIREIAALAGDSAHIFIASDHGFGPTRYIFHINVLLEKLGYLTWRDKESVAVKKHNHEWSFASLDWIKTTAYVGTPSSNGIRIRAPGEPGKAAMRTKEYQKFREKLMRQLLDYRDPLTGEQIVTRILTREEAFPGVAKDKAPDLTLVLSDHSFVSIVNEEPIVVTRPQINGTHRPQGVFIMAGPGVRTGEMWEQYSILDIAPTMLYSLGLPVPKEFEGRVAKEAFTDDYLRSNPMVIGEPSMGMEPTKVLRKAKPPYTEEEEKTIYSNLRALGYMD
jgi:predicted AlkP superfamily phosphohydrolase/phosphomutase